MRGDGVRGAPRLDSDGRPVVWLSASTTSADHTDAAALPSRSPSRSRGRQQGRIDAGKPAEPPKARYDAAPAASSCPICHEIMCLPYAGPCQHAACLKCLTRAIDLRRECPLCRRPTTCSELKAVPVDDGSEAASAREEEAK